ncbi:hypothetical protein NX059_009694 [Plenodomus lindquistii]|nr:hypothetical protein NX059_009694 [Plenodomus lindquistii]
MFSSVVLSCPKDCGRSAGSRSSMHALRHLPHDCHSDASPQVSNQTSGRSDASVLPQYLASMAEAREEMAHTGRPNTPNLLGRRCAAAMVGQIAETACFCMQLTTLLQASSMAAYHVTLLLVHGTCNGHLSDPVPTLLAKHGEFLDFTTYRLLNAMVCDQLHHDMMCIYVTLS